MKWIHVAYVESESEPGKQHEIKRHPKTGALGCGCHAYRFSPGHAKTCKHLTGHAVAQTAPATQQVVNVLVAGESMTVRRAISFGGAVTLPAQESSPEPGDILEIVLPKRYRSLLKVRARRRGVTEERCLYDIIYKVLEGEA